METVDHLRLWNTVCKTDPSFTKHFQKSGGFSGTAINAVYLIRKATQEWGPFGSSWGIRDIKTSIIEGAPLFVGSQPVCRETVWVTEIRLFHPGGEVPSFGQTFLVTQNKNGIFTDEEAPKKSLTDAITKALSWLGFAADVHLGLYDDNKYVQGLQSERSPPAFQTPPPSQRQQSQPQEQPRQNTFASPPQNAPQQNQQPQGDRPKFVNYVCRQCGEEKVGQSKFADKQSGKFGGFCFSCKKQYTAGEFEEIKGGGQQQPQHQEPQRPAAQQEYQQPQRPQYAPPTTQPQHQPTVQQTSSQPQESRYYDDANQPMEPDAPQSPGGKVPF